MDKLPPINKEEELAVAKQWYHSQFGALMLKSATEDSDHQRRVALKPAWETAKVNHNRRLKTVETNLMPQDTALFYANLENMRKYEETGDDRYFISLTRLVLQTHRRSGRQTGFMMTIMPSVNYLEQTNFNPFRKMGYIGRNKKFDGRIIFHHLDGTFANGWVYRNGKITHSMKRVNREEEPLITLKSTTGEWACTENYGTEIYYYCVHTFVSLDGGETWGYNGEECSGPRPQQVLLSVDCVWNGGTDDEINIGNENGDQGNNTGGYNPPPPPPQVSPDCIKLAAIANSSINNNYMNSLIQGRMATYPNLEHGDLRRADGTWQQKPSGISINYSFEPGVKYTHSFHSHPSGDWYMIFASHTDLWDLWRTYNGNHMLNVSDFVYGVVGSHTSMSLKIDNPTKFQEYISGLGSNDNERKGNLETGFTNAVGIGTTQGYNSLLLKLATFCNQMGIMVMVSSGDINNREWYVYSNNTSTTVVKTNCN